ncbi:hypothetical protein Y032_0134g1853 [Ancylostoma ceylanicum]|uniref:Uncharacterized protein n=1 Tax=Ancylostoma ceylanicum TaxID=53326 RepID=A0A016T683_9BILA|nr:hypothetical protein Y032_0134g1853 [Ancylostoma ceylanicum]
MERQLYEQTKRQSLCRGWGEVFPGFRFLWRPDDTLTRLDGPSPVEATPDAVGEHIRCTQDWGACLVVHAIGGVAWLLLHSLRGIRRSRPYTFNAYCVTVCTVSHH